MRENQFSKFLNKYYKKIDELVASYYTDSLAGNCATPDIARYLYEPLEHYAANGGKRQEQGGGPFQYGFHSAFLFSY